MNWQELNKASMESLKTGEYFWVRSNSYEFAYDLIHFIDLKDCGILKKQMKDGWYSLQRSDTGSSSFWEYDNEEVMYLSTHFCIVTQPEGSKRGD